MEQFEDRRLLATNFLVNSCGDGVDANPGDGMALTAEGVTTLRSAVMEANALAGQDAIRLPACTYTLTIAGRDEDGAATGDLDVTDDLDVVGAGASSTIVHGSGLDRVLQFLPGVAASLSGLTITGGDSTPDAAGGGIWNVDALTIRETTISGNRGASGGAVFNHNGPLTIENSTIDHNTASNGSGDGGGILSFGVADLINTTISGNSAPDAGGGIRNEGGGVMTLTNCTVAFNPSTFGDIYNGTWAPGPQLSIRNSIVTGHVSGTFVDLGNNIIGSNPGLGPLQANGGPTGTHALVPGSPAIDAGDNAGAPSTDQRGFPRIVDGDGDGVATVDIGAYEFEPSAALTRLCVDDDSTVANPDGSSWESAFPTLEDALAVARIANGDADPKNDVTEIRVAGGTYTPTALSDANFDGSIDTAPRSATFSLVDGVSLYGGYAGLTPQLPDPADTRNPAIYVSTLSGDLNGNDAAEIPVAELLNHATRADNAYSVVTGVGVTATIDGFTVSGGNAQAGALRNPTSSGGGIYLCNSADVSLRDTIIRGNSANYGGGIFSGQATLIITGSTVSGNLAGPIGVGGYGGGISSDDGTLTIVSSTVSGNLGQFEAGGVFKYSGDMIVIASTIAGNSALYGGGIAMNLGGVREFTGSTIVGNSAVQGGGVYSNSGVLTIINSTISANSADSGGGIYTFGDSTISLGSTIVALNRVGGSPDIHGQVTGVSNLIGDGTGMTGILPGVNGNFVGTHENPADPSFVRNPSPGDHGDLHLTSVSQPRDAGNNALLPPDAYDLDGDGDTTEPIPVDLDGQSRVENGIVDMGAYEFRDFTAPRVTTVTVNDSLLSDADVGVGRFTVTVVFSEAMNVNTSVAPSLVFSPDVAGGATPVLSNASGAWSADDTTYTVTYGVTDRNVDYDNVTIDVTGAQDAAGNPQQDYTPKHEFAIDMLTPTVSTLSPADDATGVAVDTNLAITFDEPIQRGTGDIVIRRSSDHGEIERIPATDRTRVELVGSTVTINPATTFSASTGYDVETDAEAFEDLAGNDFAGFSGTSAWSFVTRGGFLVNSCDDAVDANPGDGVALTASGVASLRSAIMEANALAGHDTITLPACTYVLTIGGREENAAATGDLDITDDVTIAGDGADVTTIDAAGIDRIFHVQAATLIVSGLTVANGNPTTVSAGGGLLNEGGAVTIADSMFRENTASSGGAICTSQGELTITGSTLFNNAAVYSSNDGDGGAILAMGGTTTITNSTLSGNRANDSGNGIRNEYDSIMTLTNCTLDNLGWEDIDGGHYGSPRVYMRNTIVTGGVFNVTDLGNNIIGSNPSLGPLQDNNGPTWTHALLSGSPAIDAGDSDGAPATDQRGVTRPQDGDGSGSSLVDIGAFELDVTPPMVTVASLTTVDSTPAITGVVSDGALQVAVNGKTYTVDDGNLTVEGTDWSLQIPGGDALPVGIYNVVATATDIAGNAGSDFTIDELVIEAAFAVSELMPTSTGFVVEFTRPFDASVLNLYGGQRATLGPADVELRDGAGHVVSGSLLPGSDWQSATFVKTGGLLTPGTYSVTLRSAADGFEDLATGELLNAGLDYTASFAVAAPATGTVTVSVPNFARGPRQAVNLPADAGAGIPLTLSDGANVESVDLMLHYDPALLTITGATVGPGMPADANVAVNVETPGLVRLGFWSPTPLSAGPAAFVNLQAVVPENAGYTAKQLLDLDEISINEGLIPALDDDGIHVVAYFGDATGNGTYSSLDTSRVSRVVVGLDTGFSAFQLADPVLVGDITGNGGFSSLDTSRISRVVVGLPVTEVPLLPSPAAAIVPSGPDPKLSIPKTLVAAPGATLDVPIHIDSIVDLTGNELFAADLVVLFNPAAVTVASVSLGDVPTNSPQAGWSLQQSNIDNVNGRIVSAFSNLK